MKCSKCGSENIIKASYCSNCANEFSEKERQDAYNKTIYGKISKLEKAKEILTLDVITSNPIFRVAVLIIILVVGIIVGRPHGNKLTILKDNSYSVSQNTENNDYYVLTEKDEINLGLYLPKKQNSLNLIKYQDNEVVEKTEILDGNAITVESSSEYFYIVEAVYEKSSEAIRIYVIKK